MMTTDQAVRLQCLELAVKAGTPWNMLTITADKLTAYVRGVKIMPSVEVKNTSTFGAIAGVEGDVQASWDKVIAKQQEAQQAQELAKGLAGKTATAAAMVHTMSSTDELLPFQHTFTRPNPLHPAMQATLQADAAKYVDGAEIGKGQPVEDETFDSQAERVAAAMQEHERDWPRDMTDDEIQRREMLLREAPGLAIGSVADKGTPVEETYDGVTGQADYPVASPYAEQPKIEPAGAASDPRLPVVTM